MVVRIRRCPQFPSCRTNILSPRCSLEAQTSMTPVRLELQQLASPGWVTVRKQRTRSSQMLYPVRFVEVWSLITWLKAAAAAQAMILPCHKKIQSGTMDRTTLTKARTLALVVIRPWTCIRIEPTYDFVEGFSICTDRAADIVSQNHLHVQRQPRWLS